MGETAIDTYRNSNSQSSWSRPCIVPLLPTRFLFLEQNPRIGRMRVDPFPSGKIRICCHVPIKGYPPTKTQFRNVLQMPQSILKWPVHHSEITIHIRSERTRVGNYANMSWHRR